MSSESRRETSESAEYNEHWANVVHQGLKETVFGECESIVTYDGAGTHQVCYFPPPEKILHYVTPVRKSKNSSGFYVLSFWVRLPYRSGDGFYTRTITVRRGADPLPSHPFSLSPASDITPPLPDKNIMELEQDLGIRREKIKTRLCVAAVLCLAAYMGAKALTDGTDVQEARSTPAQGQGPVISARGAPRSVDTSLQSLPTYALSTHPNELDPIYLPEIQERTSSAPPLREYPSLRNKTDPPR